VGKRALHLLDLIFPDAAGADPASRPRAGWSERRENRERLRAAMLRTFWQEEKSMPLYETITLVIAPDVREILEKRRILDEDLKQVIHDAESSGSSLVHPQTGHLKACSRPYQATIWVEYSASAEGFVIHNAYSHRMTVAGGPQK